MVKLTVEVRTVPDVYCAYPRFFIQHKKYYAAYVAEAVAPLVSHHMSAEMESIEEAERSYRSALTTGWVLRVQTSSPASIDLYVETLFVKKNRKDRGDELYYIIDEIEALECAERLRNSKLLLLTDLPYCRTGRRLESAWSICVDGLNAACVKFDPSRPAGFYSLVHFCFFHFASIYDFPTLMRQLGWAYLVPTSIELGRKVVSYVELRVIVKLSCATINKVSDFLGRMDAPLFILDKGGMPPVPPPKPRLSVDTSRKESEGDDARRVDHATLTRSHSALPATVRPAPTSRSASPMDGCSLALLFRHPVFYGRCRYVCAHETWKCCDMENIICGCEMAMGSGKIEISVRRGCINEVLYDNFQLALKVSTPLDTYVISFTMEEFQLAFARDDVPPNLNVSFLILSLRVDEPSALDTPPLPSEIASVPVVSTDLVRRPETPKWDDEIDKDQFHYSPSNLFSSQGEERGQRRQQTLSRVFVSVLIQIRRKIDGASSSITGRPLAVTSAVWLKSTSVLHEVRDLMHFGDPLYKKQHVICNFWFHMHFCSQMNGIPCLKIATEYTKNQHTETMERDIMKESTRANGPLPTGEASNEAEKDEVRFV
uniref:Uncharacterized protein n=1 Tax=Parascaris equorum TaxID=6256 RepID=A0A914RHS0_PAREQ